MVNPDFFVLKFSQSEEERIAVLSNINNNININNNGGNAFNTRNFSEREYDN